MQKAPLVALADRYRRRRAALQGKAVPSMRFGPDEIGPVVTYPRVRCPEEHPSMADVQCTRVAGHTGPEHWCTVPDHSLPPVVWSEVDARSEAEPDIEPDDWPDESPTPDLPEDYERTEQCGHRMRGAEYACVLPVRPSIGTHTGPHLGRNGERWASSRATR